MREWHWPQESKGNAWNISQQTQKHLQTKTKYVKDYPHIKDVRDYEYTQFSQNLHYMNCRTIGNNKKTMKLTPVVYFMPTNIFR